jgi:predicted hydrocarbon binding protein
MLTTVKAPEQFAPIFAEAEKRVGEFFQGMVRDPSRGIIQVAGERYILIRGESLFYNLHDKMEEQFGQDITESFLYDLAKTIGHSDAQRFAEMMNLHDPIHKLAAGPVHFSHTGWAFVDILPESAPSPDDNYLLIYDHPNTFESEIMVRRGVKIGSPACVFSSGYSSGWCSYSFGLDLDAKEVLCIAKGDDHCRFVMAPPTRLEARAIEYLQGLK